MHCPPPPNILACFTIMRKWKWLFLNGCKCKSRIYAVTEFLNPCQDGINASRVRRLWIQSSETSAEKTRYVERCNELLIYLLWPRERHLLNVFRECMCQVSCWKPEQCPAWRLLDVQNTWVKLWIRLHYRRRRLFLVMMLDCIIDALIKSWYWTAL